MDDYLACEDIVCARCGAGDGELGWAQVREGTVCWQCLSSTEIVHQAWLGMRKPGYEDEGI